MAIKNKYRVKNDQVIDFLFGGRGGGHVLNCGMSLFFFIFFLKSTAQTLKKVMYTFSKPIYKYKTTF